MDSLASAETSGAKPPAPPVIETFALRRCYGAVAAVESLSIQVPQGRTFGLLGPNGAGKSTTIKMLSTLLPPTSGTARIAGMDIVAQPAEVRARIGYVPQLLSADGALTGHENLLLSARLYSIPRAERASRIQESLEFMGLADVAGRLVRSYSGGMIRRLELAQAMLHHPVVLFLDEPTIGLDPVARHAVWDRLVELGPTLGTTILITTHDMDEADHLCDELAILHQGRVAALGTPEELKQQVGPQATLDDVFAAFSGGGTLEEGHYEGTRRTRIAVGRRG